MRKQIIENAAFEVAEQVRTVEGAIDDALGELAALQGRMLRANGVARIGVRTGQEAFAHLAATVSSLVHARSDIGNCHAALVDATSFVPGLRAVGFGDLTDCPKGAQTDLRIVA